MVGVENPLYLTVELSIAKSLSSLGKPQLAKPKFEHARQGLVALLGPTNIHVLDAINQQGKFLLSNGEPIAALELFRQSTQDCLALAGETDPSSISARLQLSSGLRSLGRHSEALHVIEQCEDAIAASDCSDSLLQSRCQ